MRKIIYLLLITVVGYNLQAHNFYALSFYRNAYRVADKITKQQVEYKDPGTCGQGKIWDFSNVQPVNEEYTLNYFIPDSTDMTRLCGMEHNTRYYYRQQHDSLQALGYENSTTYMEYVVPELRMHFPFAYGDTLYSIFEGIGQYSHFLDLTVKGYTRVLADAEGELRLPQGETIRNALRVRTLRHYVETGKDSVEMTLDTYSWFAAGIRYPVFESIKTAISRKGDKQNENGESMTDTTVFATSFYYPAQKQISQIETAPIPEDSLSTDRDIASVFTEAQYMPNPMVDNLYINYKLTRSAKVWFTVHNNIGMPQCASTPEYQSEGYHSSTLNISGLITGVYSLYVHVDDKVIRVNVIKK